MNSPMVAILSLILFTGAVLCAALLIARKNNWNFVQPHALHAVWLAGLMGIIPLLQRAYGIMDNPSGVAKTAGVLLLHLAFFTLPFLWLPAFIRKLAVRPFPRLNPPRFSRAQHIVLVATGLLVMVGAYVAVAMLDGFGLWNWLRFPRVGYQYFHKTTGVCYVLTMAALVFLYLWINFYLLPRRRGWIVAGWIAFSVLSYFIGYKTITVALGVQAVVSSCFLIRPLRWPELALWAAAVVLMFLILFSAYDRQFKTIESGHVQSVKELPTSTRYGGSLPEGSVVEKMLYYSTHYDDTRVFIGDFNARFRLLYGRSYLDGLWKYVPRLLVSDKPVSFGRLRYIFDVMYPGCVGSGHMPDVGGPPFRTGVEAYLNFGLAGVCLLALLKGLTAAFFLERMISCADFFGYAGLSVCMGYPFLPAVEGSLGTVFWYLLILAGLRIFHRLTAGGRL